MSLARPLAALAVFLLFALPNLARGQDSKAKTPPPAKVDQAGDPLPDGAIARLGTTRFRHTSTVSFLGFSGDGSKIITVSNDNRLNLWDLRTGQKVKSFTGKANPRRYPNMMDPPMLSGDGKKLLFSSDEADFTVVDTATGKVLNEFRLAAGDMPKNRGFGGDDGPANQLSYDGKLLLVIDSQQWGNEAKIAVFDTTTGKLVRRLMPKEKNDLIAAAVLSRDGKTLVTVEGTNPNKKGNPNEPTKTMIRFWNIEAGAEVRAVAAPSGNVTEIKLIADGKKLLVRDRNANSVRLLDADKGTEIRQFTSPNGTIRAILPSPEPTLFVADFKRIVQFDVNTGKEVRDFATAPAQEEQDPGFRDFGRSTSVAAAISPDGKLLAVGEQATLKFFDVATGKESTVAAGHRNRVESVSFGAGGKVLTSSADGKIFLWDAATSKVVRELVRKPVVDKEKEKEPRRRYGGQQIDLFRVRAGFSPDGKTIAGQWFGEKLYLFDAATGEQRHQVGFAAGHSAFCFAPDGRSVVVAALDGALGTWDSATGKQARTFVPTAAEPDPKADPGFGDGLEGKSFALAFSADGRTLVVGGVQLLNSGLSYTVKHIETASGQERVHLHTAMNFFGGESGGVALDRFAAALDNVLAGFALSPDGKLMAELGFSNIKLRSLSTGKEVRGFSGREISGNTGLFSPDGKIMVAGKYNGALRLWDVATGTVLLDLPGHDSQILALAFSADGKWLVSGARDSSVLIWDWEYVRRQALKETKEPALQGADSLWTDLASKDAGKANLAMQALAGSPKEAITLLKTRLKPATAPDRKKIDKLVDDLDSASSDARDKAQRDLEKLGDLAADIIKERLKSGPPFEVVRRLEEVQRKLSVGNLNLETLQALRGVEVLELIGTPEARSVLEAMTKGAPGHRVTLDAQASLRRLAKTK